MAFDATVGGANSTSYLSVARADEIASERLHSGSWTSLSTPQKQSALIMASRLFTSRVCLEGEVTYPSQALLFPRTGLTNRNGTEIDPETIPVDVEYAVFEWVLGLIPSDTSIQSAISAQGITSIKAGPVALTFKDSIETQSIPSNVLSMLPSWWLCPTEVEWSPVVAELRVY